MPTYLATFNGFSISGVLDLDLKFCLCNSLPGLGAYLGMKDFQAYECTPIDRHVVVDAIATWNQQFEKAQTEAKERDLLAELLKKYPDAMPVKTKLVSVDSICVCGHPLHHHAVVSLPNYPTTECAHPTCPCMNFQLKE